MNADEALRQFAREVGGEFIEAEGGFWTPRKGIRVVTRTKQWNITVEMGRESGGPYGGRGTNYARMSVPYVALDWFRFEIYRRAFFRDPWKRFFGMHDVDIEFGQFDPDLIIKSNDESKVRALLANQGIRESIQASQAGTGFQFKLRQASGERAELFYKVLELVDVQGLRSLHQLFAGTLNELCEIGSASEEDPEIVL